MAKKTSGDFAKGYGRYIEASNLKVSPVTWIAIAIIIAALLAVLFLFALPNSPTLGIMAMITVPIVLIGFPIIMKERRDTKIEDSLSDVFEEVATSLRAGATIEQALLDLTKIQKGPLIDELKIALNDMESGFSFEEALENLIARIDVVMLKRIFKIVIDGRKAGGELADILEAVASDSREMARLQRERTSKTLMYVIFIFVAGSVVAPLIFGFITEIGGIVANVGSETGNEPNPLTIFIFSFEIAIFWLYLLIESFVSGIMLSIVRGVRLWKGLLLYSLGMALVATLVFEVSRILAAGMLPASF
jgi:flagellar protein FlaJ